jgi:peptidoglycan/LPS O-acetylase OafA/YrhL
VWGEETPDRDFTACRLADGLWFNPADCTTRQPFCLDLPMSAASQMPSPAYRRDVDGLRGLAVAAVVGFHAFPQWFKAGFIGVDIFFVISGFLITDIVWRSLSAGGLDLAAFYARRVRRLLPALVTVMASVLVAGWALMLSDEYAQLGRHVWGGASFISNLLLLNEAGNYFDADAAFKPLVHLWSLAVEEQFYLVWPVLLVVLHRCGHRAVAWLAALGTLSMVAGLALLWASQAAAFYLPVARVAEFVLGAIVAVGAQGQASGLSPRGHLAHNTLAGVGAICLCLGFWLVDGRRAFPGLWVLLPTVGTALLIATGPYTVWPTRVLSAKPLVELGLISYPLYLWHWPLLAFAHLIQGGLPPRSMRIMAVLLALVLAWLTWRWVEQPIRRRAAGPSARTWWAGDVGRLGLALCALGAIGALIQWRQGLPERIPQLAEMESAVARWRDQNLWPKQACPPGSPASLRCLDGGQHPKVVVVGDSHGLALVGGLQQALKTAGLAVSLSVQHKAYCLPLRGVEVHDQLHRSLNCLADYHAVYDWAAHDPTVRAVILVGRWAAKSSSAGGTSAAEGGLIGRNAPSFTDGTRTLTDPEQVFVAGLNATVQSLASAHKPVLFVHQVPEYPFNPPFCGPRPIPLSAWTPAADRCTSLRSAVALRQRHYRELVNRQHPAWPGLMFTDPMTVLCDARTCAMWRPELGYLYRDDDHINDAGARLVSADIVRQLRQLPGIASASSR